MINSNTSKPKTKMAISAIFILAITALNFNGNAQDTIKNVALLKHIYKFDLTNGSFSGDGATFLMNELEISDFVLLGEYHGSARISEFTNALIPTLSDYGYKTMMAEVGPSTGQILNSIQGDATSKIKDINDRYLLKSDDGDIKLPIPFFNYTEEAQFLETLKNQNWRLFGLDQEFLYGFPMLIDKLYENLSKRQRQTTSELYKSLKDSINQYYKLDLSGKEDISVSLKKSVIFNEFLGQANVDNKNAVLINDLNKSIEIYYLYATRQWFENNQLRVSYMKSLFKEQLKNNKIDLSKEKILFKMGSFHLSKGFSSLNFYEIGNMVSEVSEFYNKRALHITFSSRYFMENGEVKDILESDNPYYQLYKELDKYGSKDEWVIIDLRPIIKGYFYYPRIFEFNEQIIEIAKSYDLLIIPKTEIDPTPNYNNH